MYNQVDQYGEDYTRHLAPRHTIVYGRPWINAPYTRIGGNHYGGNRHFTPEMWRHLYYGNNYYRNNYYGDNHVHYRYTFY